MYNIERSSFQLDFQLGNKDDHIMWENENYA